MSKQRSKLRFAPVHLHDWQVNGRNVGDVAEHWHCVVVIDFDCTELLTERPRRCIALGNDGSQLVDSHRPEALRDSLRQQPTDAAASIPAIDMQLSQSTERSVSVGDPSQRKTNHSTSSVDRNEKDGLGFSKLSL